MSEQQPGSGHNSSVGGIAADRLRSITERFERLDYEVRALRSDQKDLLSEARSAGFDPKVLRQLFAIRRRDPGDVEAAETLLAVYRRAMGM